MLVEEKRNVNFNLPPAIHDEFERMVGEFGNKKKWAAISAAILMLAESDDLRRVFVQAVAAAEVNDSFADLIARAKDGSLREDVADAKRRLGRAASENFTDALRATGMPMKKAAHPMGKQQGKPK